MVMLRRPLRKLSISKDLRTPSEKQRDAQERYQSKLVIENPKYALILASLKEGVPVPEIAGHFVKNNWVTVNERTFAEALRTFRRNHQELIDNFEVDSIDRYVDPNAPALDARDILMQTIRLQKMRIAIDVNNEKSMGKLFNTTYKEIQTLNESVELLLKMDGKLVGPLRRGEAGTSGDVNDNLSLIKKDESTQNRLHALTRTLVEAKS